MIGFNDFDIIFCPLYPVPIVVNVAPNDVVMECSARLLLHAGPTRTELSPFSIGESSGVIIFSMLLYAVRHISFHLFSMSQICILPCKYFFKDLDSKLKNDKPRGTWSCLVLCF